MPHDTRPPIGSTAATIVLALAAAALAAGATVAATGRATTPPMLRAAVDDGPGPDAGVPELLHRFPLHGLLLPLVDVDASPARWQDPALALPCGPGTRVSIDGQPVQPGTAWNGRAFTVRWQMDACQPFGVDGPVLHGALELDVYPEDDGLSAIVRVGPTGRDGRHAARFVGHAGWTL